MGRANVKLFLAGLKRQSFGAVYSSPVRSRYNKRTMGSGLVGHLGLWAECEISKLRVISVMD